MEERKKILKNIYRNKKIFLWIIALTLVLVFLKISNFRYFMKSELMHVEKLPNMRTFRADHESFLLKDGRVLITGGLKATSEKNNTIEILDLKTKTYKSLNEEIDMIGSKPVMLNNGQIVFFQNDRITIFDPEKNRLYDKKETLVHADAKKGAQITPILLNTGKILILGPWKSFRINYKYPVEIFDPNTNTFAFLKDKIFIPVKYKETHHYKDDNSFIQINCIKLSNGKILVFLKNYYKNGGLCIQVFDPSTEKSSIIKGMNIPRYNFKTVLLKNGKVLILGGLDKNGKIVKEAELFNPKDNSFSIISSMLYDRQDFETLLLKNGKVLIIGGWDKNKKVILRSEIYDSETNSFKKYVNINFSRVMPNVTELENNKVLVYGGYYGSSGSLIVSEIEICDNKKCNYEGNKIFNRYFYDLIKIEGNTYLFTGGGNMISAHDSSIGVLSDSYLIKFNK